jgi:hypothetical protein
MMTKILASFKKIKELLTKNLSSSSQKYGFGIRDPGSEKNLFRIRVQGSKRHLIPDPGSATLVSRAILFKGYFFKVAAPGDSKADQAFQFDTGIAYPDPGLRLGSTMKIQAVNKASRIKLT